MFLPENGRKQSSLVVEVYGTTEIGHLHGRTDIKVSKSNGLIEIRIDVGELEIKDGKVQIFSNNILLDIGHNSVHSVNNEDGEVLYLNDPALPKN